MTFRNWASPFRRHRSLLDGLDRGEVLALRPREQVHLWNPGLALHSSATGPLAHPPPCTFPGPPALAISIQAWTIRPTL